MKKGLLILNVLVFSCLSIFGAIKLNEPAPPFTAINNKGEKVSLADYKGKIVVLEWTNHGCPFVKKFYKGGAMQRFQKQHTKKGDVWLSIVSSAPGKQGQLSEKESQTIVKKQSSHATDVLLDPSGIIGSLYDAKTTPHIFVIDEEGVLRYQGAIDSIRSANPKDIKKATNYITQAVKSIRQNKAVEIAQTRPYGCAIKY